MPLTLQGCTGKYISAAGQAGNSSAGCTAWLHIWVQVTVGSQLIKALWLKQMWRHSGGLVGGPRVFCNITVIPSHPAVNHATPPTFLHTVGNNLLRGIPRRHQHGVVTVSWRRWYSQQDIRQSFERKTTLKKEQINNWVESVCVSVIWRVRDRNLYFYISISEWGLLFIAWFQTSSCGQKT